MKAGPSGRSPTAIVGSNTTGGMDVSLFCVSGRGPCDELISRPRGVLPTVARRCV
jgi:hypothetical protein